MSSALECRLISWKFGKSLENMPEILRSGLAYKMILADRINLASVTSSSGNYQQKTYSDEISPENYGKMDRISVKIKLFHSKDIQTKFPVKISVKC